ncbi:MAG: hypothetical protein CXR30_00155 [Geobacter sp.]|nr:MAG: hypothetical protein CXR30_00155 [Geobacter sp.]
MFVFLGRWAITRLRMGLKVIMTIIQAFRDYFASFRQGRAAIRMVFLKQVYFTGWEGANIIVIIAVILGTVIIAQVVSLVGDNGSLTGKILVWVVLRELAPLLTAVIVIARSGTAIAAELGTMKINGEIEALELLGIPTERYLIMPRVMGVTTSVVILTLYFVLTAFIASFLVASVGWHIPYDQFIQGILSSLGIKEILVLLTKSLFFGMFVSATCCCYGLGVGRSATEVPQAATRAVMTSLITVFLLDGLITYLSSLSYF